MKDSKTNETYCPLSRGLLGHLTEMGGTALQIYIYLLLRAKFRGKDKGTVRVSIGDIGEDLKLHRQTVWKAIKRKLIGKYVEINPAKNQHNLTEFKIKKYKTVQDFRKFAVSPETDGTAYGKQSAINLRLTAGLQQTSQTLEPQGFTDSQELKEVKTLNNNIYTAIFNHWNEQKIITHREIKKFIPHIKARLEHYTPEEIKEAISNYAAILKSDRHYFSYKWGLDEFLSRKGGLDKFMTVNNPFTNYLKKGGSPDDRFKAI